MQQPNNYHYTFEELQTYLYSYADLFQQDRVQDGIHLYSKNAKNIFKEMQKVNDKIKEKQEKYYKKINEKREKMAEAIQAYTQKHRDDKYFNEKMLDDKDIRQCRQEMKQLEEKLKDAVKAEQEKFMQWERKEMKGQNVILRNNNYISAAGKSNAIKKGLIGSGDIASFGNIDIKNDKNETIISGNLADIVHSVTNLLHKKAQAEKDKKKKSEIEEVIQKIINSVKDFFGIQAGNKDQLDTQLQQIEDLIKEKIENYLDNNFQQVKTNLNAIERGNERGKMNYRSGDESISDLASVTTSMDEAQNKKKATNININERKDNININTGKLLDEKQNSRGNIDKDKKLKDAIRNKEIANKEEIEIPVDKITQNKKESQIINSNSEKRINESYVNEANIKDATDEFGDESKNINKIKSLEPNKHNFDTSKPVDYSNKRPISNDKSKQLSVCSLTNKSG